MKKTILKICLFSLLTTFVSCTNQIGDKQFNHITYERDLNEMIKADEIDTVTAMDLKIYINHRLVEGDSLQNVTYNQLSKIMWKKEEDSNI